MISRIYYLALIQLFAFSDAAPPSGRAVVVGDVDEEDFFLNSMKSILDEINELRKEVTEEGKYLRDSKAVVEAMCHDFEYPVKTILEFTNPQLTIQTDPPAISKRFRRDDKTTTAVTQNYGSSKDYMSSYYAQRKAIMDKYKSQQKEIMERVRKTKNLIAESKRIKESKKIDLGKKNVTQEEPIRDLDTTRPNITYRSELTSTIPPNPTSNIFSSTPEATSIPLPEVPILNSSISNDTRDQYSNSSNDSFFNSSEDSEADDYSSEIDLPNATLSSPVCDTLTVSPFENNDDKTEIDRSDLQTLERDWPSESVNFIPQNEVDFNLTEPSLVRQVRDNDTMIFNLEGHLANPSIKNDSALDQLEKMFLWEVPAGDQRISRSNETDVATRHIENNSGIEKNPNTILAGDLSGHNSSQASDSLRFMVEIKSSPDVQVKKYIKNSSTSTTTYRNSTHEIIEINGVVNSTKRINGPDLSNVDLSYLNNSNSTNSNTNRPAAEIGGGARESEWCEECPHDYRWGDCEGTLFYQHTIFLRNRGPAAIDATFGMNVEGPISITCVEAIRYNRTRGIVTLHSGGPGHDFAKLRIRGFQGEGFSYIMKVWGVRNDQEFIDSNSYSY